MSMNIMKNTVLALSFSLLSSTVLASPTIKWHVEAGFAPFGLTEKPSKTSEDWMPTSTDGVIETFDHWYLRIATGEDGTSKKKDPISSSPYSIFLDPGFLAKGGKSPWDAAAGHYQDDYARPKDVTILASVDELLGTCEWLVRSLSLEQPIRVSVPCKDEVRLIVPLAGANISVTSSNGAIATAPINVEHRVVVGLGDSYGSGEGNPDIPTQWRSKTPMPNTYEWFASSKADKSLIAKDAQWFDTDCHRSFWSHQTYTAMRLAAENPHRLVTFLHYACSGAEIFDGMLVRQQRPPGLKERCKNNSKESCFLRRSQLAAAVIDLCEGGEEGTTPDSQSIKDFSTEVATKSKPFYKMDAYKKLDNSLDLRECKGLVRKPDLVLISIGGNDAGFAQLAMWAIVPQEFRSKILDVFYGIGLKQVVVCPDTSHDKRKCKRSDVELSDQIERRYGLLATALKDFVEVPPERVVISSLPDPIRRDPSAPEKWCADNDGVNVDNAWDGARGLLPNLMRPKRWAFNIIGHSDNVDDKSEAEILATDTLPKLRKEIRVGATSNGFIFAADTSEAFVGHGWCERAANDQPVALPSSSPNEWRCSEKNESLVGSPACWKPYQPAERYIRTLNDSMLTQASSRGDGINGSVHPTAQGQAAIAMRLIEYVHRVLPPLVQP